MTAGDCELSSDTGSRRFFCPQLAESGSVELAETEAHHAIHVLRARPGDVVELFDGAGLAASCRITTIRKRDLELEVIESRRGADRQIDVTIATAVPKGDRFDWLVEKATELGVSRLIPLVTARSVVDPRSSKLEKQRQTVIAACKQSGRNHLMQISPVTKWSDFLSEIDSKQRVFVAHPGDHPTEAFFSEGSPMTLAIGPEGGFTDVEVNAATAAGARAMSLGRYILRIETAAVAFAARVLM